MFNKDFYPTPKDVALKMIEGYSFSDKTVLEPSAGKGDLANVIADKYSIYRSVSKIHVIEKDVNLQAILRSSDKFSLVDSDFLEFSPQINYDYIIMNPPFSNGLDHLIHAIEIGNGAEISCLLNNSTINGDTQKAISIRQIVSDRGGSITNLGSCFIDSERTTRVEVALIRLKTEKNQTFDFKFEKQFDRESSVDFSTTYGAELAIKSDLFEDYELRYNLARKAYAELLKKGNEFIHYASSIASVRTMGDMRGTYPVVCGQEEAFFDFCNKFRTDCWQDLFSKTKIAQYLPSQVKKTFLEQAEKQGAMNFTAKNMRNIFIDLFLNKDKILQQCVESAFDHMTKYHSENRVHIEGWKSNDRWQVSRKVVLPNMRCFSALSSENRIDFDYRSHERIVDIHLGLCWMLGLKLDQINAIPRFDKSLGLGEWHDSEFFEWKMFKKGTLHLKFKDENLWKKFNITACKGKNWLKGG